MKSSPIAFALSAVIFGTMAAAIVIAYAQPTAPLPPSPQHAISQRHHSPMIAREIRIDHPSGATIVVTMPTNMESITVPAGYELKSLALKEMSLERLHFLQQTNDGAMVYWLEPKP
jgi:hypothetical protein